MSLENKYLEIHRLKKEIVNKLNSIEDGTRMDSLCDDFLEDITVSDRLNEIVEMAAELKRLKNDLIASEESQMINWRQRKSLSLVRQDIKAKRHVKGYLKPLFVSILSRITIEGKNRRQKHVEETNKKAFSHCYTDDKCITFRATN